MSVTYPFPVRLDSKLCLAGTYDAMEDETVFELPYFDITMTRMILSSAFGADAGEIISVLPVDGDPPTITLAGDYSAGVVTVGRPFAMTIELSQPYDRNRDGVAYLDTRVTIRKVLLSIIQTGGLVLRSVMPFRADRLKSQPASQFVEVGTIDAWFTGNAEEMKIKIESQDPRPCTIASVEYTTETSPRRS